MRAVDPSPFFMVAFVVGLKVVSDLVDQALIVRRVSRNSKLSVVDSTLRRAVQSVVGITVGNLGSSFFKTKFVPLRTVACPGVPRGSADVTELRATRAAVTCQ